MATGVKAGQLLEGPAWEPRWAGAERRALKPLRVIHAEETINSKNKDFLIGMQHF